MERSVLREKYIEDRKELLRDLSGKVLDIACNKTKLQSFISDDVIGIDINITNYTDNVIKADAEYLLFKDDVFDMIFAGEIIEHVPNPYLFLQEMEMVLKKKNGNLF